MGAYVNYHLLCTVDAVHVGCHQSTAPVCLIPGPELLLKLVAVALESQPAFFTGIWGKKHKKIN